MLSPTAFTALIITFHDLSILAALIFASIISLLVFWLFLFRRAKRSIALVLTFLSALFLGLYATDRMLDQDPLNFEIIRAG